MRFELIIDKDKEECITAVVHSPGKLTDAIEQLVLQYTGEDTLAVFTEDSWARISLEDIECIVVEDGKTFAVTAQGKYRLRQRLYVLEQQLPQNFMRINKSTLANKKKIVRFSAAFHGAVNVVFQSGFTEYVSRRCFAEIKRRYLK